MSRSVARIVTALLLLSAGPAVAETLYNKDGVQLSATARVIDPGAATCRIREERHTAEQYEKLQPNHGQPLNVWRVELVAANYSGKALDYLSAHLQVDSAWPPCDNWDGLGNYGKPVVWTGPLMTISDVGSIQPGDERREVEFVLVWHEEEPALGRWDINYDFAAGGVAARADGSPPTERPEVPVASETQREPTPRSLEPAPDQTCVAVDLPPVWNPERGEKRIRINWTGDCTGGLANGAGKEIYDLGDRGKVVYEGTYVDGKKHGHWTEDRSGFVSEGTYVDGKKHGHWTERDPGGYVSEGAYVDGKKHGYWNEQGPLGVSEGSYVHGEQDGYWIFRQSGKGDEWVVYEGLFVEGSRNGQRWTRRWATGDVTYECYAANGDRRLCK